MFCNNNFILKILEYYLINDENKFKEICLKSTINSIYPLNVILNKFLNNIN